MKKNYLKSSAVTLTSILIPMLISACGGERQNDAVAVSEGSLTLALGEITTQTIVPAVDDFYAQTQTLTSRAESLCSDINSANLQ